MVSNKLRANRVVNIVSKYTGNDGVETQEDALADLLTDLRHYCHARNVDFLEALNMSATWYADDVYNPNLIDE